MNWSDGAVFWIHLYCHDGSVVKSRLAQILYDEHGLSTIDMLKPGLTAIARAAC